MSDTPGPESKTLVDEVVDPRLFLFVVTIAVVSVTADYLGVGVLGVETLADAIETALVMTAGSYLGVVVIDVGWRRLFGR
ncbi:hypothetical protein [Haloarchaeobius iranensis]|uniref:Uncharacterized protein n=1 Tax=Haloarchaeobius iranensis TaxID=996166 RepID=A0A1G9U2I9_9EURY|nr:hypothetical protein [Haloarchaeobius iranensis]SDM54111.1 hypothetical protein SAMN05192554_103268 [Haloarchaeobius iranensis]